MKLLLPAAVFLILLWMRRQSLLPMRLYLIFTALCIGSGLLIAAEMMEGGRRAVTAVARTGDGSYAETVPLEVETSGGQQADIQLRIPEEAMQEEEGRRILEETIGSLDETILGENTGFDRIEYDLMLPASLPGSSVEIAWQTDAPEVLGSDGKIGTEVPGDGAAVRLTARLYLKGYTDEYLRILRVFPSKESRTLEKRLQAEADLLNSAQQDSQSAGDYLLPASVDGERVTWYQETEERGTLVSAGVLLLAVLTVLNIRQKKQQKEEERKARLVREYPELVSRLGPLLESGLSLRMAVHRIGRDNGGTSLSGAEAARCWYEMESGVLEQDAYMHFGERCGTPEYRRLALLLVQSQKKGSQILSQMLEREIRDAYEGRKRAARTEGEKNAVRLILPMGMMLVVVLIIILVPAILSF